MAIVHACCGTPGDGPHRCFASKIAALEDAVHQLFVAERQNRVVDPNGLEIEIIYAQGYVRPLGIVVSEGGYQGWLVFKNEDGWVTLADLKQYKEMVS